jgi:hypothetical protein
LTWPTYEADLGHERREELLQKLADAALMQMNIEFGADAVTLVGTAPAYHAVGSWDQGRIPRASSQISHCREEGIAVRQTLNKCLRALGCLTPHY